MLRATTLGQASPTLDADEKPRRAVEARDGWVESVHLKNLERLLDRPWAVQSGTIFRVSQQLPHLEPTAYQPQVVSLGPYHCNRGLFANDQKPRYYEQLLSRNPQKTMERCQEEIIDRMLTLEDSARRCYTEPLMMSSENFVEIMTVDACFVVEFLFKLSEAVELGSSRVSEDLIDVQWLRGAIIMDMLLLENQLPFFLLREVLDIVLGTKIDHGTGSPFLYLFVDYWPIPPSTPLKGLTSAFFGHPPYHLLHLFRRCIVPHLQLSGEEDDGHLHYMYPRTMIPSATTLSEAGVVFREFSYGGDDNTRSLRFHNGTMIMPPLAIGSHTNTLLHNLVAFEQGHPASGYQVTSYVMLMCSLASTEEDVALLQWCGVLNNSLGGIDFAARSFSSLREGCRFLKYNRGKLYTDVLTYCSYSLQRWVESVHLEMECQLDRPWAVQSGTIFRLSQQLPHLKPEAYMPQVVSLGPYHCTSNLSANKQKQRYRQELLTRNPQKTKERCCEEIRGRMLTLEDSARRCYTEPLKMSSEDFVEMMTVDACFVVEFLFKLSDVKGKTADIKESPEEERPAPIPNRCFSSLVSSSSLSLISEAGELDSSVDLIHDPWHREAVIMDMLLLENQLPFFLLREVLDIVLGTKIDHSTSSPFLYLFVDYWPIPPSTPSTGPTSAAFGHLPYHLLHLFRRSIVPHLQLSGGEEDGHLHYVSPRKMMPSATKLRKAGVVFREFSNGAGSRSLRFHNGTMSMPPLAIGLHTNTLFHNLIAFEQGHPASGHQVTSYVMLMCSLASTEEDVALLQWCGVLNNSIGGTYFAAESFSSLRKGRRFLKYNRGKLYTDVLTYCRYSLGVTWYLQSRWAVWLKELMDVYFRSPWAVIAFVAAFLLLVLTVIQTVYAILPSPSEARKLRVGLG